MGEARTVRRPLDSEALPPAPGPFSTAIRAGDLLFVSGHVGVDPRTDALVGGGIAAETAQVLDNLRAVLAAAGRDFCDVAQVRVFLADMADFAAMNAVYAQRVPQPYPARTTVAVAGLPLGARVEIDLVALA